MDKAYKGKLGEKLNEAMIKNGNLRIVGLSRRGARLLTANKPIPTPVATEGPEAPGAGDQDLGRGLEGNRRPAHPGGGAEVFTALQTGAVNGQENPVLQISEAKLYEVQKFVMMTEHLSTLLPLGREREILPGADPNQSKDRRGRHQERRRMGSGQQVEKANGLRAAMEKSHGVKFIEVDKQKFSSPPARPSTGSPTSSGPQRSRACCRRSLASKTSVTRGSGAGRTPRIF